MRQHNRYVCFEQGHLRQTGRQAGGTTYMQAHVLVDDQTFMEDHLADQLQEWANSGVG